MIARALVLVPIVVFACGIDLVAPSAGPPRADGPTFLDLTVQLVQGGADSLQVGGSLRLGRGVDGLPEVADDTLHIDDVGRAVPSSPYMYRWEGEWSAARLSVEIRAPLVRHVRQQPELPPVPLMARNGPDVLDVMRGSDIILSVQFGPRSSDLSVRTTSSASLWVEAGDRSIGSMNVTGGFPTEWRIPREWISSVASDSVTARLAWVEGFSVGIPSEGFGAVGADEYVVLLQSRSVIRWTIRLSDPPSRSPL